MSERNQKSEELYSKFSQACEKFDKEKETWDKCQEGFEKRLVDTKENTVGEAKKEAELEANKIIVGELLQSGKIGSALHDAQRIIIQFMTIFVTIFRW